MGVAQAKKLRAEMTDAERTLWYSLRAHRFDGYKFKRQVPIGPYVVDFASLNNGVVVEVDGGQHADSVKDLNRDAWLEKRGLVVLRFWNNDVLKNTNAVLEMIMHALTEGAARPLSRRAARATLSPAGRGDAAARASHEGKQS
ncbi:MAG: endonuclease domain-containing protein [Pseudolabrys sp.]